MEMPASFSEISLQTWAIAGGILLAALIGAGLYFRHRASMQQRIRRALKKISHDLLEDIHLPDGMGGHIHVDVLLLTNRGFVVLDVKDVPGTLFGADKMAEWVVMNGHRRHTFRNPLPGLHDRLAVLRGLVRDVRSEGYLVFTEHGKFTKGKPSETVMLNELVETLGPAGDDYPQAFDAAWRELKAMAEKAEEETQRPHV
ncbi:MAG TPA: nuclease-related domain-containing protein [Gammaproteobacteria bacterium]